ncbi:MAG TPA: HDIG domain-containing protein [Roseiflexaceae bacterium]|nr:HDIG domain-containing protein [Roseiflexaceae bacterium]
MQQGRLLTLWRRREPITAVERPRAQRHLLVLLGVGLWLVLWGLLSVRLPTTPGLKPGEPSPVTIQAGRTVTYVSAWRTEQERARAESAPDTAVYQRDPTIPVQQRLQLVNLLQTITQIREDPSLSSDQERSKLTSLPNSTLVISSALAADIAALTDEEWRLVRQSSIELYDRALNNNSYALSEAAIRDLRELSLPYWASLVARDKPRDLIILFSSSFLKVNRLLDEEATRVRKAEARDAVEPVTVRILQGENIVRQGDVVTPDVEEKLRALDEVRIEKDWSTILGHGLLAAIAAGLFAIYLGFTQPQITRNRRPLLLTIALIVGTALAGRLLVPLGPSWLAAFPLATTGLLLAALFNRGVGMVSTVLLSLFIALLGDGQLDSAAAYLIGAVSGIFALGRGERSLNFVFGGLAIAGGTIVTRLAFQLTGSEALIATNLLLTFALGLLNGLLSTILALGLYNVCGHLSGLVTPLRLMELAHPAQPLLRKLIREAPGTYYHSVAVGNLAESAAEAIGADALLLRVGSYYHDIGKTIRPYFFTDNQSDRENVHDDLDPRTSAEIIADHVREGEKMARAAGLPEPLIDLICTHHGTSVIKHFYNLALQQNDSVDVADFTYPGPKPRTREEGIMMLADSVEATVRSKMQHGKVVASRENGSAKNGRPGVQTLDELVASIIDERIHSGQLDDCALTIREISRIQRAFLTTLHGIYHPRVEYAAAPGKPA